jgi:hypothetical protein
MATSTWIPVNITVSTSRCDQCGTCGSIVPYANRTQHTNFHATFTNRKDGNMSSVLWCDKGDHAFNAKAPGSAHFEGTQIDENGANVFVTQDICAEHNPNAPVSTQHRAQLTRLTNEASDELKPRL